MPATNAERLANRKPIPKPVPAYLPSDDSSPLNVDKARYTAFREAPRVLVEEFTLPIRSGKAWKAPAGSIVKISTPEGPQVGMHFQRKEAVVQRGRGMRRRCMVVTGVAVK